MDLKKPTKKRPEFLKETNHSSYLKREKRREGKTSVWDEKIIFLLPSSYFKICPIGGTRTASGRKQPRNNYSFIISIMRKY